MRAVLLSIYAAVLAGRDFCRASSPVTLSTSSVQLRPFCLSRQPTAPVARHLATCGLMARVYVFSLTWFALSCRCLLNARRGMRWIPSPGRHGASAVPPACIVPYLVVASLLLRSDPRGEAGVGSVASANWETSAAERRLGVDDESVVHPSEDHGSTPQRQAHCVW